MKPAIINLEAGGASAMTIVRELTAHVKAFNGAHIVKHFNTPLGAVSKPLVPEIVGGRTSENFAVLVRVLVGLQMRHRLARVINTLNIFGF
jgi:hypothetical protein